MEQDFANKSVRTIDRAIAYVATHAWVRSGVYVVAFLEATISPLLPELVVAAILSYRKDISWKLLSVISALGSATGAGFLYIVGKYVYAAYQSFFDGLIGSALGLYTEKLFEYNTFVSMFLAALTPLPDRVFAFLSGIFALSLWITVAAFFLGRLVRVGIVAYFSYHFGDEAREFILKHTRMVSIVLIAVVLLFVVYKTAF